MKNDSVGRPGKLIKAGYYVIANDQRGHGGTIRKIPGDRGEDGWMRFLKDAYRVNSFIRDISLNPKIFMLGHSMGSSIAIHYACLYGNSIDSLILSGPPGFISEFRFFVIRFVLKLESLSFGKGKKSKLMQKMLFERPGGGFGAGGSPGFEWLSRDEEVVAAYVSDDECGFVLSIGSLSELFGGV
jgi:Lysophospholipase